MITPLCTTIYELIWDPQICQCSFWSPQILTESLWMFELPLSPVINQKDHLCNLISCIQNSPSPSTVAGFIAKVQRVTRVIFSPPVRWKRWKSICKDLNLCGLGWIWKLTTTTEQKDAEKQHLTITKENKRQAMCLQRNTCVMAVLILWRCMSCTHVQRLPLSFVFPADTGFWILRDTSL